MSSRPALQQLRTDLLGLQSAVKELHSQLKISPDNLAVPSWRYPEKTAANVQIHAKDCEDEQLLLELLVDRLILIVQSCVMEMDRHQCRGSAAGRTNTSGSALPLSLTSAIKRFVRGFSQQSTRFKELNKNVDQLREQAYSLQQTLTVSERQCKLYHEIITKNLGPSAVDPLQFEELTAAQPSIAINNTSTVGTQTMQTSLMSCIKCPTHLQLSATITKMVHSVTCELTHEHSGDIGPVMEDAVKSDLTLIKEHFAKCEEENALLREELRFKQSLISQLEDQTDVLRKHVTDLQNQVRDNQRSHEEEISHNQTVNETRLTELKGELSLVVMDSKLLHKEVSSLKKAEAELRLSLVQKNEEVVKLQSSLESSRKQNEETQHLKEELDNEIVSLKRKHKEAYKALEGKLEDKSLQLNKTSTQLINLEDRCKYLQSKQTKLLSQVDELDQKCCHFNKLLSENIKEKSEMKEKLAELSEKCAQAINELQKEKTFLDQANAENQTTREECYRLQEIVRETQECLKDEREKTHLLMEYPFSPTVPKSLTLSQSQQYINANTARILLLEEQNQQLRYHHTPPETTGISQLQINEPIRLWQAVPRSSGSFKSRSRSTAGDGDVELFDVDGCTESSNSCTSVEPTQFLNRINCTPVDLTKH